MANGTTLVLVSLALLVVATNLSCDNNVLAETIKLTAILPKLEKIHEDTKILLIKNAELKNRIQTGLKAQNATKLNIDGKPKVDGKLKLDNEPKANVKPMVEEKLELTSAHTTMKPALPKSTEMVRKETQNKTIDYEELSDFNNWVDTNLEYAVKNTQASIEAFKDDAEHNNGNVEYSEQAIKDGEEGVKYWQSAVIFQDKTLNNEQFVAE